MFKLKKSGSFMYRKYANSRVYVGGGIAHWARVYVYSKVYAPTELRLGPGCTFINYRCTEKRWIVLHGEEAKLHWLTMLKVLFCYVLS